MLGEATLDALGTFLGEAIRVPIQFAALQMLRGKQDEKNASIGMRKCRRMRDEGRAWPDRSCESGDRRGPARGRVFWRSRSVDNKRVRARKRRSC